MILSVLLAVAITIPDPRFVQANLYLRNSNAPPTTLISNECGVEKNGFTKFKAIDSKTNKVVLEFWCNDNGCKK